ncbi:transposase [Motilibacter peucedani]|uniref:Transposase n=1 Tax=Motilibacter peucedani TaxID=598650 RepID=A0A420XPK5_9ACTN|nr:IS110 family transposase [Motilibacter peucedani]RKS74130.1 transposase [Motilibacter peucedani]
MGSVGRVVIGTDPHKASATIEVVDEREVVHARGRFGMDRQGYALLLAYVRQWPCRVWAVEGANGTGRPLAQRLLADGERVLDVPAKLSARVRVLNTGQGRKTDATDAHSVAVAAVRGKALREVSVGEEIVVLRLLCDRRDELSRARAQALNRLHRLLLEIVPGGAPRHLSPLQARHLLATVRPRDPAGRVRKELAGELVGEVEDLDARLKTLTRRLRDAVQAQGSGLLNVFGIGPAGAARILADVQDVARFRDRNRFASWTGTAPIDASSGEQTRHRLSRAGNRRLNHVLYIAAIVQIRHDTVGRTYYRRKIAEGKTKLEALRCLRRRLSDVVYRQLVADAAARSLAALARVDIDEVGETGSGGHFGASTDSSAADLFPGVGTSDQPHPEPAPATLPPPSPAGKGAAAAPAPARRRARGVNVERPTGRTTLTPTNAAASSSGAAPRP